jgi:hypothetical protein
MKDLEKAVISVMLGEKKVLTAKQQQIDVHEPEKDELTAKDFEMLRAGKKAKPMKEEEQVDEARFKKGEDVGKPGMNFAKIAKSAGKKYGSKEAGQRVAGAVLKKVLAKEEYTEEEIQLIETAIEEGWDDMMKSVNARSGPQPSGGSGVKHGTRYGGSKQVDTEDEVEEPKAARMKSGARMAGSMKRRAKTNEETNHTFGEYLQAAKQKYGEEEAVKIANDAFNAKDTSIFSNDNEA